MGVIVPCLKAWAFMWLEGPNRHTPHLNYILWGILWGMCCFLPASNPALPLIHTRTHGCLMLVKGQTATPPLKGTPGACESTPITSLQLEVMNQLVTLSFYSAWLPASLPHPKAPTKGLLSENELAILTFLRQMSVLLLRRVLGIFGERCFIFGGVKRWCTRTFFFQNSCLEAVVVTNSNMLIHCKKHPGDHLRCQLVICSGTQLELSGWASWPGCNSHLLANMLFFCLCAAMQIQMWMSRFTHAYMNELAFRLLFPYSLFQFAYVNACLLSQLQSSILSCVEEMWLLALSGAAARVEAH